MSSVNTILTKALGTIRQFWEDFVALPEKLKENWTAYFDLERCLTKYIEVLPILLLLAAKEIRNRHWLQVMQATGTSLRLEAAVFRLDELVDSGLEKRVLEIGAICGAAKREQELESQMRLIEEEWNEQVFHKFLVLAFITVYLKLNSV